MTVLWIAILILTVLAVLFLFWPLFSRSIDTSNNKGPGRIQSNIEVYQQRLNELEAERKTGNIDTPEFDELKLELQKSLLADVPEGNETPNDIPGVQSRHWITVSVMGVITAITSLAAYGYLGRSDDLALALANPQTQQQGSPSKHAEAGAGIEMEEVIQKLENKLANNPDDVQGWSLLAYTYLRFGRHQKANEAFSQLQKLVPESDPNYSRIMGAYAQARYLGNEEQYTSDVEELVEKSLSRDPLEPTALTLVGLNAFKRGNFQSAVDNWNKALQKAEKAQADQFLKPAIAEANEKLGISSGAVAQNTSVDEVSAKAELLVRIDISPELRAKANGDQTVFIFARPVGGRMPLAATRLKVSELPKEVMLNDEMAMTPAAKLSLAEEVEVTARVSFSGQPFAKPGDFYNTVSPIQVKPETQRLELTINQVQ